MARSVRRGGLVLVLVPGFFLKKNFWPTIYTRQECPYSHTAHQTISKFYSRLRYYPPRLLEHVYYHTDEDNALLFSFAETELEIPNAAVAENETDLFLSLWRFNILSPEGTSPQRIDRSSFKLITYLCDCIAEAAKHHYGTPDSNMLQIGSADSLIVRATLCKCYHLALHCRFREARDILHFMNLYEKAVESDVQSQILYNRCFAQVGLCAFRLGLIPESHHYLMELCTYNKAKELLAQGRGGGVAIGDEVCGKNVALKCGVSA